MVINILNYILEISDICSYFMKFNLNIFFSKNELNTNTTNANIMEILYKNYFSSNWNGFLQNNIEIKLYNKIFKQIDDYKIYEYIYISTKNYILIFIESFMFFFEKILIEFIYNNILIQNYIWYHQNYMLISNLYIYNVNVTSDKYYNNIIELLVELELNYNIKQKINLIEYFNKNLNWISKMSNPNKYLYSTYGLYYDIDIQKNNNIKNIVSVSNSEVTNIRNKDFVWNYNLDDIQKNAEILQKKILKVNEFFTNDYFWLYTLANNHKWKFGLSKANVFLWYKTDHWLFGKWKIYFHEEKYRPLMTDRTIFKFFGGFTYYHALNTDFNIKYYGIDKLYSNIINIRVKATKRIFEYYTKDALYDRKVLFARIWLPTSWVFYWDWRIVEAKINYMKNIEGYYVTRAFANYILSDDIWDTKRLLLPKKKIFKDLDQKINVKQILIKCPKMHDFLLKKENYTNIINFDKKYLKDNLISILKIQKYIKKISGNYTELLQYTNRSFVFLKKSHYYSNKWWTARTRSLWCVEYTKDLLYNNNKKKYYFLTVDKILKSNNNYVIIDKLTTELNTGVNQIVKNSWITEIKEKDLYNKTHNVSFLKDNIIFNTERVELKKYFWEKFFIDKWDILNIVFKERKGWNCERSAVPEKFLTLGTAVFCDDKEMIELYNIGKDINFVDKMIYRHIFNTYTYLGNFRKEYIPLVEYSLWARVVEFIYVENSIFHFIAASNSAAVTFEHMPIKIREKIFPGVKKVIRWWRIHDRFDIWGDMYIFMEPWIMFAIRPSLQEVMDKYYRIHDYDLFFEKKTNIKEKNIKKEYIPNYINFYENEKIFYERIFFFKDCVKTIKKILKICNIYIINIIIFTNNILYIFFKYNYIFWILIFTLLYIILLVFLILILKSLIPTNNIYGYKFLNKKKKNLKKSNLKKIFREYIDDQQKFFEDDQRFIYSLHISRERKLKNFDNIWIKQSINNKYYNYIKSKIKKNYNILYKKILFEESIENTFNNKKYIISIANWAFYFIFFKNTSKSLLLFKAADKLLNNRFFNWKRILIKEPIDLTHGILDYYWLSPEFPGVKKVIFFIKLILGFLFIIISRKLMQIIRFITTDWYFKYVKGEVRLGESYNKHLLIELDFYFEKLKKKNKIEWFKRNIDYVSKTGEKEEKDNVNYINIKNLNLNTINFLREEEEKKNKEREQESNIEYTDDIYKYNLESINKKIKWYEMELVKDDKIMGILKEIYANIIKGEDINNINEGEEEKDLNNINKDEEEKDLNNINKGDKGEKGEKGEKDDEEEEEKEEKDLNNIKEIIYLFNLKKEILKKKINIQDFLLKKEDEIYFFKLKVINYLLLDLLLKNIEDNVKKEKYLKKIQELNINIKEEVVWYKKYYSIIKANDNDLTFDKQINYALHTNFILYRWYSFIGDRIYYYIYLITTIFTIWTNSLKKLKYNEYNMKNLLKIIYVNIKKFIKIIYLEYVFSTCDVEKNLVISIKNIIIFSLFLIPIILYINILLYIYIIYYYIYILFKYIIKIWSKLDNINSKLDNINIYRNIKKNIKLIILIINFIFFTKNSGKTVFFEIYNNIYILIGKLEKLYFLLKKKDIKIILQWLNLNYIIVIEDIKIKLKKKKINKVFLKKITLIWLLLKFNKSFLNLKYIMYEFFHNIMYIIIHRYIIYYLEKNIYILYINIFNIFIKKYIEKIQYIYYGYKYEYINIKNIKNSKNILKILIYLIKKSILKYIKKKWKNKKLKLKFLINLDNILNESIISKKIYYEKYNQDWYFEKYLEAKSKHYLDNKSTTELDEDEFDWEINWEHVYINFLNWKQYQIKFWYEIIYDLENLYILFGEKILTRRWSPLSRLKLGLKIIINQQKQKRFIEYKQYKNKEISRNIFFYKKWKKRRRVIYIYFIKGCINWISYLIFKKVIFKNIKKIKNKKLKIKNFKAIIKNLNNSLYFTSNLNKIPPQLWALSILYDYYYFTIIFFILYKKKYIYHNTPEIPKGQHVKWKINPYFGTVVYEALGPIGYWNYLFVPENFRKVLERKPKIIGWRYFLYYWERLGTEGWSQKKIWTDISLLFGITYDSIIDKLKYEGKKNRITTKEEEKQWKKDEKKVREDLRTEVQFEAENTSFDINNDLLIQDFERIERLKNAFTFKIAFDTMYEDNAINSLIRRRDPDEDQKRKLFWLNDMNYTESLGLYHYNTWEDRNKFRWRFEKHIIYLQQNYEKSNIKQLNNFENLKSRKKLKNEVNELLKAIGIIYYDITLKELKYSLKQLININIKKNYIEDINIYIEPSIIINLNYEQYKNFPMKVDSKMALNPILIKALLTYKNFNEEKSIKMMRIHNIDDMLMELKDVKSLFYENSDLDLYELTQQAEKNLLMKKFYEAEFYLNIVLSMDFIDVWNKVISKRITLEEDKDVTEYQEEYLTFKLINDFKNDLKKPIIYLNFIKWNWKQWLYIDLTEKERLKLFKKNTIVLNEKYNIWNLKLIPIRVKLPIKLKIDKKEFERYMSTDEMDTWDARNYFMPLKLTNVIIKEYLQWQKFKKALYLVYNKTADDMLLWWLVPDKKDEEAKKLNKKYWGGLNRLRILFQNYSFFSLKTTIRVAWDLLLYHRIWSQDEDFTHTLWFLMRLKTLIRQDVKVRFFSDNYENVLYTIFSPNIYMRWYHSTFRYRVFKYIAFLNWIWILYLISYCPGEYFYNIWLIVLPTWISIYFMFLWLYIKKYIKEDLKNRDFYLYKFQSSRRKPFMSKGLYWYNISPEQYNDFETEFGINGEERSWKANRYAYIRNRHNTFSRETALPFLMFVWFWNKFYSTEMWRLSKYRGYDWYKKYEEEFSDINAYKRVIWVIENWERLWTGGNSYNIWYINYFRKNKKMLERKLDNDEEWRSFPLLKLKLNFKNKKEGIILDVNRSDLEGILVSLEYDRVYKKFVSGGKYFKITTKNKVFFYNKRNFNQNHYENYIRVRSNRIREEQLNSIDTIITNYNLAENKTKARRELWRLLRNRLRKKYRNRKKLKENVEYFYDLNEFRESFKNFIINSRYSTEEFIQIEKNKNRKNNGLLARRQAFETETPLDINILLHMSEYEKHINILYYNLLKYKVYRYYFIKKNEGEIKYLIYRKINENINSESNITYINKKYQNWEKHFYIMKKLNKYILNLSITEKKLDLIIFLMKKKIINFYDLYDRLIKFSNIMWKFYFELEFIEVIKNIIKLFFQ